MNTVANINEHGIALIRRFESLSLDAYRCPAGKWTIGWGHTRGVKGGDRCTVEQAEQWLREDLAGAESIVRRNVRVPLNENQFSALVSWAFNTGGPAGATLWRVLNAGDYDLVPAELRRWVMVTGQGVKRKLNGLVNRREAEIALWRTPVSLEIVEAPVEVVKAPVETAVKWVNFWQYLKDLLRRES